ncbi:MAG: hypothetical protein LCH58_05995 [Bacteroidetes bacterium]|uniref:hypothetical protein n=1 Tax=Phnomibacter sp. TaxID=2836217 RepID=UPI002FDEA12A|nr:hypothetical protein [Bacteroidota bacterium]
MSNKLSTQTMSFRKRFNLLALPLKFEAAKELGSLVSLKIMPTGRPMTDEEHAMLQELAEWCNDAILFNRKPNGGYDEYFEQQTTYPPCINNFAKLKGK